jgi:transglutaminase-like putative cysteine protease
MLAMKYEVTHRTSYHYAEPVTLGHNSSHLTPRTLGHQRCLSNRLVILPAPSCLRSWTDYFGNQTTYFTVEEEHRELSVTAVSEVAMESPPQPPLATAAWEEVRDGLGRYAPPVDLAPAPYVFDSPCVVRDDRLASYASMLFTPGRALLEAALDLTARIYREFRYDPTATSVSTPTMEVFEKRRGVCQDFAHLEIACLRSLGLAARYVSGYLLTDPRPGQPKLVGADATHAWLSIFCPGHGWVDLDPTNNVIPQTRHVTLAWGRDYGDVCPIKGLFLGGGSHWMSLAVDVVPVGDIC